MCVMEREDTNQAEEDTVHETSDILMIKLGSSCSYRHLPFGSTRRGFRYTGGLDGQRSTPDSGHADMFHEEEA